MEYSIREWFRLRYGRELWDVHPSDIIRYDVCREVAQQLMKPK
jgi:hypothetical protein